MPNRPHRGRTASVIVFALALCLCFFVTAPAHATIPIVADYSSYRLAPDHDLCLVELCYSLSRDSLAFKFMEDRDCPKVSQGSRVTKTKNPIHMLNKP